MRAYWLIAAVFTAVAANAATITVSNSGFTLSAQVSGTPTGPSPIEDHGALSVDYLLLITGGTGDGMFSPLMTAQAPTNESGGLFPMLGGTATVSSPVQLYSGDLYSSASPGHEPLAYCSPVNGCLLPFTFGVAQIVHFQAAVDAVIQGNPLYPVLLMPGVSGLTSTAKFDGVAAFDKAGTPVSARDVSLVVAVPEPYTAGAVALLLAVLVLVVVRRRAVPPIC